MLLKKLKLTYFRNYLEFEQEFNNLKTIIIGQNAQGKSNILEAINILATSQSERALKDSDLVSWEKDYALIFANIEIKDSNLDIALQINTTGRRKLKINGVSKKAPQADLVGNFFAVMFSCNDLDIIKGSPSFRRGWLDSILFQLDNRYNKSLNSYQKSITQKNSLLKQAQERQMSEKELKDQLEIWNEQIINLGTEIISTRIRFIEELEPIAREFLNKISKDTEKLDLIYKSTIQDLEFSELKVCFKKALQEALSEEVTRGQSLIGPHRDDLIFLINKKDAKSFASQGQQRSIILAIKLSELKIIEKTRGEIPVLLLDDVLAELDEYRQDFLLHNLPKNIQTFLTTTHISDIQKGFLENSQILNIERGKVLQHVK